MAEVAGGQDQATAHPEVVAEATAETARQWASLKPVRSQISVPVGKALELQGISSTLVIK